MSRHLDFRVHARAGFRVEVVRYDDEDEFGILVHEPAGVAMEAVLSRAHAEKLAADLGKELQRDHSEH